MESLAPRSHTVSKTYGKELRPRRKSGISLIHFWDPPLLSSQELLLPNPNLNWPPWEEHGWTYLWLEASQVRLLWRMLASKHLCGIFYSQTSRNRTQKAGFSTNWMLFHALDFPFQFALRNWSVVEIRDLPDCTCREIHRRLMARYLHILWKLDLLPWVG